MRAGAPWCTQCYAPTSGASRAPAAAPEPQTAVSGGVRVVERPPAQSARPTGTSSGTWPCSTCSHPNELALALCEGCGTPFLAAVREARPTIVLPGVGDLLALSPVRRVGLAVSAVVAFVLVSALLALLLA